MNVPFLQDTTFTGLISTKDYKTSQEWSQAYTLIQANSANWEESAEVIPTVTNYLSTNFVTLCSLDSKGQILSAGVDLFDIFLTSETDSQTLNYIPSSYQLSISNGNTVNLSSINSLFGSVSGKYEDVYSNVVSNSGSWNTAYNISTAFQQASSSFATNSFVNNNFLNLTGGTVTGNLTVQGNVSALGSATFANTIFTTTSALSVVNTGPGPALYVYQAAGPYDVASFYDGDGIEVLHVGNAGPGGFGKVGVNESFPNEELTVRGSISASESIFATSILSGNRDLADIFLTSETDSQTLTFTESSAELSISNGNTVSLSSLSATILDMQVNTIVVSNSAYWNNKAEEEFAVAMSIGLS